MLSWRVWDLTCQVAARSDTEELEAWISNPDEFREHRRDTELSFGDQGPAWLRLEPGRLLTSLEKLKEARTKQVLRQKRRRLEAAKMRVKQEKEEALQLLKEGDEQAQELQQLIQELEEQVSEIGTEMKQLTHSERTARISPGEAPRWRVTVWARQGVRHWFDPKKQPVGFIKKTVLVVYGVHCRLENISQEGTWIEDERFWVNGVLIERKAGEAVPANIMQGWRKLRQECPDLFQKDVLVWQQPAAVVDQVLYFWYQKLEASETRQQVRCVDMLKAGWTEEAQEANFLFQSSQAKVNKTSCACELKN